MTHVLLLGLILLLALIGGHLVKILRVPEVVGYLLIGLFLGPSFTDILTHDALSALEIFSEIALGLILFSIGAVFDFDNLKKAGKKTLLVTLWIMLGTSVIVFFLMLMLTGNWHISLLLSVIAIEISPIATILVLRELNTEGPLTDTVYNILAINNVGCIISFGIVTFILGAINAGSGGAPAPSMIAQIFYFFWEMVGSLALGIILGSILAGWASRVSEHGEVLILVLGMLMIVVGLCHWLGLSSLIATMMLGATLINLEKQSRHLFSVLGRTDPPLYAIFFVLAGADLDITALKAMGIAGAGYTVARILGKIGGSYFGAGALGLPEVVRKYLGLTLVPHAGVAIGLVLQLRSTFPAYAEPVSAVILASVLINEIIGPIFTRYAMLRAGEVREERLAAFEAI